MLVAIAWGLGACMAVAAADPADSLGLRLDRIRTMVGEIGKELDSLRNDISAVRPGKVPDSLPARADRDSAKPIFGELLTERERTLAAAADSPFRRLAVGYSFDPVMPIGMHVLLWGSRWGLAATATARFSENRRQAGAECILLRSLHRFSLFEGLQTHLYAFAGSGLSWRREPYHGYYGGYPSPAPTAREWYGEPDLPMRLRIGAGSELGLLGLGGIRGAPEIGFQALHYLSRYQDSDTWAGQYQSNPGFESKPKSDFSLGLFFAFHLSFYFR